MTWSQLNQPVELEDLPNIGKVIAADLRRVGIRWPAQLAKREPLAVFRDLAKVMGRRHDPCVLYTLLAAHHFLKFGDAQSWWHFTAAGRKLLSATASDSPRRPPAPGKRLP